MGNLPSLLISMLAPSPPKPVTVHLTHLPPRHQAVPGYVAANNYTLEYTLIEGHATVGDLLSVMGRYGEPTGSGILGVMRLSSIDHGDHRADSARSSDSEALPLDTKLHDGDRLGLVV